MRPLDQITLETEHLNHIQIDRYWLLPSGKVGVDSIREQVIRSSHFPTGGNNSRTPVKSKIVELDQCPTQVKTAFTATLNRRMKRPIKTKC